ncbi:uncharacterized protein LTR77_010115 [Saxophila tyrrhenica]|uniref:DUF221-domain-containing protein n=1 Tax=Saxophila tyrrhenica TaxID=1690608 RepID=A0AAV9NXM1_9PEZI|nr:hypothetical protein LTR77_010115 [Saxophila tyrrhenica]
MVTITDSGHGGHRSSSSTSGAAILAAFIPTFVTAVIYIAIFAAIRDRYRKIYAPRTFLGSIPEKDRTPEHTTESKSWVGGYRNLPDHFVLQHNSLDAWLFLRFLKFIIGICLLGCILTFPILLPANITGGGTATQLDRLSFSNIDSRNVLWAHVLVAWVFFSAIILLIARERLRLIGIRQAYLLDTKRSARLSSRTVLFLNAPPEACQSENLEQYFGSEAERSWPVRDAGDLEDLVARRSGTAFALENAEVDLIKHAVKRHKKEGRLINGNGAANLEDGQPLVPNGERPKQRKPPVVGSKFDPIDRARKMIGELAEKIDSHRASPSRNVPEHSAIFVAFSDQSAAHRAYQQITFPTPMPMEDRFLSIQPKEVLWHNLAMPLSKRLSKASTALAFVIAFTIFFSIPVGIIGTISNAKYLAENVKWLRWLDDLPPVLLGLLTGLVPPYLTSWFVSYVPKLFRHVAKLSGEPTTTQAELKTQAWYFVFQVFQVFLVTTFSSGAAAVFAKIAEDPQDAPKLLASSLPKASNFYLTYFILQGTSSAADTVLNYSDLFEWLFNEKFMDKTPRQHYSTFSKMKGTPWASWYPKFTNFLVISIVYACVAPLVLGFATAGLFIYYLAYRYQLLFVCQTKVDTQGEAYKRALQQMPTGLYLAELCLIGLFGAKKAAIQTTLMVVLLILTAVTNLVLDRTLRPLELYLGVDVWQAQEVPLLAREDNISISDAAALHASSHARRLGLKKLPHPAPRVLSDFFDGIISSARMQVEGWLDETTFDDDESAPLKEEDIEKAYLSPAFTSKTPKLWIPRDKLGVSKEETQQNADAGLVTTDEAAEIDEEGKLHWDHRFENVPIWSKAKVI